MTRWHMVFIGLLFVASPFLMPGSGSASDEPDLARGASLYSANCARCHNARAAIQYSDHTWPLIVTHMRVIAGLPGDQARVIEAFLRASNNPPIPPAPARPPTAAASVPSGDELVQQYGCRGCHRIGGAGGSLGPNLDTVFERRDEAFVRAKILRPKEHNPSSVMPQFHLGDAEASRIIDVLKRSR